MILIAGVVIQLLLTHWQFRAGMDYARLYESRTGHLVLLHGIDPWRILLSPSLREPGFTRVQEDPELEAMRTRYVSRRNLFIAGTLLDWLMLYLFLNVIL
ncbi:MAG: hypothetical protein M3037_15140 [Gemmatimonadota bacterium]|nr:hypothetical protein [Gemmatimonadota bacterium]